MSGRRSGNVEAGVSSILEGGGLERDIGAQRRGRGWQRDRPELSRWGLHGVGTQQEVVVVDRHRVARGYQRGRGGNRSWTEKEDAP